MIKDNKEATCKKCNIKFPGMSELRKHQWVKHKSMYKNLLASAKDPQTIAKARATRLANKLALVKKQQVLNGTVESETLTAAQLLDKLRVQQDFMNNVVHLVSGLIQQHEVGKK